MMRRRAALWVMVFFVLGGTGYAKEQQVLDEVTVTATRTERKTEEVAAGISVVGKEVIDNSRLMGLKEVLNGVPGVQAESKNGGYDSRLIIRGAGLKARYGVREIMIMLDGVPITDPDGMSRLDFVDTQLVERVDVVKGPNSTLYGANAAGGIINVITKNPYEEVKNFKVGYGSDNTQLYSLIYGTSFDNTYATISATRKSTNGWREWNKFDTTQTNLKLGHIFTDKSTLDFTFSYTDANIQLPGTLTGAQFGSDTAQLTSEPWRNSGRYSDIFFSNLKYEKELGAFKLKPMLYYTHWSHYHPVTGLINDGGADVFGLDFQADWKHTLFGVAGTLTSGVAAQMDVPTGDKYEYRDVRTVAGRITSTYSDVSGLLAQTDSDTVSKWGVYVQESLQPSDKLIIDAGIRFDQVLFDLSSDVYRQYNYSTGKYEAVPLADRYVNVSKTYDYVSPRIGAVYKLTDVYSLYGNVSTGFQTPQSSELSENRDLDPAKTINYEIGARARYKGGHSIDLSLFYMDVTDEIVQSYVDTQTTYSNAGSTTKMGIELAAKAQPLEGLTLGGSYTYSDFSYDSFTEYISGQARVRDGNQLPYIPRTQFSLNAFYRHPTGFKAKVDSYSWGKYYVDNGNSVQYPGYWFVTNLLVGWENKSWDVTFDVANLFDKHYAMEVTMDSRIQGGRQIDTLRYRPGAPISYFGRISYKF